MGNYLSSMIPEKFISVAKSCKRRIEDADQDDFETFEALMHVSKRRKLMSTSEYIYKTLFIEGKEADVTVKALDNQWHLHKVYLCQSPYFNSMFSGNWKESNDSVIDVKITDENITVASLQIALGSLYRDDIEFEAGQAVYLLATSVFLQMETIVDQCIHIMKETINILTVLTYHNAASCYGVTEVERACTEWLLVNLLSEMIERPWTLMHIPIDLMHKLVSSPNLYAIQTEYSIYMMLKVWLYLNLNPTEKGRFDDLFRVSSTYFKDREGGSFLKSSQGRKFAKVFAGLRIPQLLMIYTDFESVYTDRILPPSWIQSAATQQWHNMIRINEEYDRGPSSLDDSVFLKKSCRCGRVLVSSAQAIWRWTGYNFNLDLVLTLENSMLKLKRNHRNTEAAINSTQQIKKQLMYRADFI